MLYPSKRIKDLREDNDLTQQELSERLNIERTTLSGYETGVREPSLSMLVKIASFFRVSTDYLLGRTDIPTPYPIRKK